MQDTSLLHGSKRDNILHGRHAATSEELHDAAERAESAAFIHTLTGP